jgi:iron complex outermembrane recepter protein
MNRLFIIAITVFFIQQDIYSQVRGLVNDAETGKPVQGAAIIFGGTAKGVISNEDGRFETEIKGRIIITAIGYKTKKAEITSDKEYYIFSLEPEYYDIQEVVVEAYARSRRILDVPGSLSLIQAGQIERESPVTVVPVLNQAPGIFAHSGALNTSRITIRGIGARVPYATGKVRAFLNNIPLTNGSGISIVEDIDPSVMERIEVIKGPATSVYGAGLGGTIIITAKDPTHQPAGVSSSFQAGSWDLFRNTLSIETGGEKIGLSMKYNHTQSNGYRQNNEYRSDGITLISRAGLRNNTDITLLLAYTSLKAHIPSSIDSLAYVNQPRSAARNWLQTRGYEDYNKLLAGMSAEYNFNSSLSASLSLFSTLNEENEMRPFDVLNEDRFSGGTRFKLSYTGALPAGSWQLLGGGELYTENFKYRSHENIGGLGERGIMISDNKEQISYYNVFAQVDLDLHRLIMSAGINMNSSSTDYNDLFRAGDLDPSGKYSYGQILSPRLSANYRYYQSNSLFMTVSHGFSPPSLSETLTPEGSINPEIRPETSWNTEAGLRGNLFDHRLFYDINLYRMKVTDILVAERVGEDAWVGKNAGESVHRGLEVEFQIILLKSDAANSGSWWQPDELTISPNLTVNNFRFTDFIDEGVDYSGNYLPGIPDRVLNAGIYGALQGGLYAVISLRNVGQMPMNDKNSLYSDPYHLTVITAGLKRKISDNIKADVWISARNIFNVKYASMILVNAPRFNNRPPRYYYPGNPVNFSAGIKFSYLLN